MVATLGGRTGGARVRRRLDLADLVIAAIMIVSIVLTIYPVYYILINSVSAGEHVASGAVKLLPRGMNLFAYEQVFADPSIRRAFFNTILYTVLGTAISVALTAMCAYPLSRPDFYGRRLFTGVILFTMFFSGGIIPLFLTVNSLGMYDRIWAVVLPSAISVYNMIVMRTFFQHIPYEITESAYMDGATDIRVFWTLVLPLSTPILATMILFYGVGNWNAFYNALIFLSEKRMYPLQLLVRNIVLEGSTSDLTMQYGAPEGGRSLIIDQKSVKFAVVIATSLPVMIVYPFAFKYFQKGIMIGSVKG